jgi:hypothetical protein
MGYFSCYPCMWNLLYHKHVGWYHWIHPHGPLPATTPAGCTILCSSSICSAGAAWRCAPRYVTGVMVQAQWSPNTLWAKRLGVVRCNVPREVDWGWRANCVTPLSHLTTLHWISSYGDTWRNMKSMQFIPQVSKISYETLRCCYTTVDADAVACAGKYHAIVTSLSMLLSIVLSGCNHLLSCPISW